MSGETPNPLRTSSGEFEDTTPSPQPAETARGRVNIKDVLLDCQAHNGVNSMCITLVVICIYFKFLGELTSDQLAKNNVQMVRPRAAASTS